MCALQIFIIIIIIIIKLKAVKLYLLEKLTDKC